MEAGDGWSVGAEDAVAKHLAETFTHVDGEVFQQLVVAMAQVNIDEAAEGGVRKHLAFKHLGVEHLPIVVGRNLTDDVAVGRACLEDDMACMVLAPCSSCHLAEGLEGTLIASEVGQVEHGVGIEDANHRDIVEIESFGHHLGAYEDVGLVVGEIVDDVLVVGAGTGGVEIHAEGGGSFEQFRNLFLNLFGACSDVANRSPSQAGQRSGMCVV